MTFRSGFVLTGVLLTLCLVSCLPKTTLIQGAMGDSPRGFVPLFNGKDFSGWEGNLDIFRIEEGAIVGGSLKNPLRRNEFLCTTRDYDNFELRLEAKLVGRRRPNAGIQIRSRRIPNHHEVSGYQVDMAVEPSRNRQLIFSKPRKGSLSPVSSGFKSTAVPQVRRGTGAFTSKNCHRPGPCGRNPNPKNVQAPSKEEGIPGLFA